MPLRVCIEGNVGCGKSTLLAMLEREPHIETRPEPVEEWKPFLKRFYENPARFALAMNLRAMLSLSDLFERPPKDDDVEFIVTERSSSTAFKIFAQANTLEDIEYEITREAHERLAAHQRYDAIIYLRASPHTCMKRTLHRAREGEFMTLRYLQDLHDRYDDWLLLENASVVNTDLLTPEEVHDIVLKILSEVRLENDTRASG